MPKDGKAAGKLLSSNIASGSVFWKVIWKHILRQKIIDTF